MHNQIYELGKQILKLSTFRKQKYHPSEIAISINYKNRMSQQIPMNYRKK